MLSRRSLLSALTAAAIAGFSPVPAHAADTTPTAEGSEAFIKKIATQALETMKESDHTTAEERERKFQKLLDQGFDLPSIGRLVLGRHWRAATPEQRADYLELFRKYVLKTYVKLLSTYSQEVFQVERAVKVGKRDMNVGGTILRAGGPPIRTDWRVRIIDGEYKIVDVKFEGISMVLTQRSEFNSVVNRNGMDGLLKKLRARTAGGGGKATLPGGF